MSEVQRFDAQGLPINKAPSSKGDVMSEERAAAVYDDELAAIKDSRNRGLPLFAMKGDKPFWVVAASDHQAKLALVDRIYPLSKVAKRDRDDRYTKLLEVKVMESGNGSKP